MEKSNVIIAEEESLLEAIRIYLWAVSAGNEGDIKKANVEVAPSEAPYFKIDTGNCLIEVHSFSGLVQEYCRAVIEGAKDAPQMALDLATMVKSAAG